MAIHFGGFKIAVLAVVYVIGLTFFSKMWKPDLAIKGAIASFFAFLLVPVLYFRVFDQNLLWTLYSYTAMIYSFTGIMSLFSAGNIAEDIRFAMISLPIAYLTNLIYVGLLEGWAMKMFVPTLQFPFFLKISLVLFLVVGAGVFVYYRFLSR